VAGQAEVPDRVAPFGKQDSRPAFRALGDAAATTPGPVLDTFVRKLRPAVVYPKVSLLEDADVVYEAISGRGPLDARELARSSGRP
jgi:hypothetical protein